MPKPTGRGLSGDARESSARRRVNEAEAPSRSVSASMSRPNHGSFPAFPRRRRVEPGGTEVAGHRNAHPASSSETHASRKRMKPLPSRLGVATQWPQGESQGRSSAFGMCSASMALSSGGK